MKNAIPSSCLILLAGLSVSLISLPISAQTTNAAPVSVAPAPAAAAPAPVLDFGDFAPATIRMKASAALDAKNYDAAIGYADKCIELFSNDATAQQAALTAIPTDKDTVFKQWALNEVGVAYLVKGQALEAQNKKKDALAAYKTLVDKFAYAQCWDPQGWFWTPADQARERVATLASS
jgi:tetratricopeptide (TPR) repeat protein